jgi:peptidoglycan hydrolase-like protein with peptidoglycan-binding domain
MALQSQHFRGDLKLVAAAVSDSAHIVQGASGEHVLKIQQALIQVDGAAIKPDGKYGPATARAVSAFKQKRNILNFQGKIDDIVGKKTMAALDGAMVTKEREQPPAGGEAPRPIDLFALLNELTIKLNPIQRASFVSTTQPLIADRTLLANTIALEAIIVILILLFFATLLVNSQNKANQEAGRELTRKVNNLREKLRADPSQAPAVSAQALKEAKDEAKALAERARVQREKCFEKFTPDQFAQKSRSCAKFITAVTTAIQSLIQKATTPTGGGITPESLIKGISASAAALITALRELGACMGCDNLFF